MTVRDLLSSLVMRVWSGLFCIPEILALQQVPLDGAPSAALSMRTMQRVSGIDNLWGLKPVKTRAAVTQPRMADRPSPVP
jgi:hypothetical protein